MNSAKNDFIGQQPVALNTAIELEFNSKSGLELTVNPHRVWIWGLLYGSQGFSKGEWVLP